ncbi:MAG TPA: FAD-dependent oxidoreductase [Candidatus Saccharimonadales bacterium]|nr:FAD-dependent oxidoreductase [Candidatus Saccharimonadales bacterium]
MKAVLHAVTWHVPGQIAEFWFKPAGRFTFVPGEYTELFVPHQNPDDRGQSREFSIASTPQDKPYVSIITTFPAASQQQSTFKQALRALQPGAEVDLAQARGDFVLPKDLAIPIVFVVGGIGIVPALSVARSLVDKPHPRHIQVLHSVSNKQALLGAEIFADICDAYVPVSTVAQKSGLSGRVTASQVLQQLHVTPRTLFYLAGPKSMTRDLQTQLIAADIPPTRIVVDEFSRYDP